MKNKRTLESWMMANGKCGDIFYSDKKDRHLTAISTYYKRKIITERLVTVTSHKETPSANMITKVTIIDTLK